MALKVSLLRTEYFSSAVNVLETVLTFSISLRQTSSKSITFRVINKYDNGTVVQISTMFPTVYHVAS